jgi:REP element-mobilizing transposase RayT
MSRPLRIEFENAWYHVMNRGRHGEAVFHDATDYQGFMALIRETREMWGLRVAAFCLMPNHYHLLVQTPQGNISRCLRHINGVYTQRFNRRHQVDGQLFRGRYKSILVDGDSYLLELVRYIHRNPVRAGLADQPGRYPWSSYQGYLSRNKKWDWLDTDLVMAMFSTDRREAISAYRKFMEQEDSGEIVKWLDGKKWPAALGTKEFLGRLKGKYSKADKEIPQLRELAPELKQIRGAVCAYYGIDEKELPSSRRGVFNEPRNMAILLTRRLTGERLVKIANEFGMNGYSSVSSVLQQMNRLAAQDKQMKLKVEYLIGDILKSQRQT